MRPRELGPGNRYDAHDAGREAATSRLLVAVWMCVVVDHREPFEPP
jgi:hypothetical protein